MREASEWKVDAGTTVYERDKRPRTRSLRSATPRLEKLNRRIASEGIPASSSSHDARRTRNSVLPVPGPPTTNWGPSARATARSHSSGSIRYSVVTGKSVGRLLGSLGETAIAEFVALRALCRRSVEDQLGADSSIGEELRNQFCFHDYQPIEEV